MLGGSIFPDISSHILVDQRNSKECAIKARGAAGDVPPFSIALLLIIMAGKYINLVEHRRFPRHRRTTDYNSMLEKDLVI
jgi:hypothetical protein